jgi:hypothetical protein
MAIFKDVSDEENEVLHEAMLPPTNDITPPSDPPEIEQLISLHALTSFSTP